MTDLRFTLVGDGPSDRVLLSHLRWLVAQHCPPQVVFQSQWADLRALRERPKGLSGRLAAALDLYPCDLLFVHRDAEREDPQIRHDEINQAIELLEGDFPAVVPVVPVRMTEAWLLFDESAIRRAAGNPNGTDPLSLSVRNVEDVPDPKAVLHAVLRTASGLSGRRRQRLNVRDAVHLVGEYIDDFSPLRGLSAFQRLEDDLATVLREAGWT